jgi:MFS family permease
MVAIAWVIVQIAYNFSQGPLSAVLPDRVPSAARGRFSSITGLGTMVGAIGGQALGAQFTKNLPAGYLFFGGLALVVIVLFVVFNPDVPNKTEARDKFSLITFLKTFWVNPRKYPDFFWGFTGRLLLFIGYYLVSGYQLYILSDYIGLKGGAAAVVPLVGVASLVGIIISMSVAGPISDKLGRRRIVAVIAGLVMAVSLLIPLFDPTLTGMLVFSFFNGLGFGAYMSVDGALMSEVLPSKQDFGKDLGVLNIAATLPQTLGPAIAGAIVLLFHGYAALFPIGAGIAIIGALAVIPIKSVR